VGSNVDGWCTKCKLVLAHTIEAAVGAEIIRVHCNTCNSKHAYRASPPGVKAELIKKPRAAKSSAAANKKLKAGMVKASDLGALMLNRNPASAKPYTVKGLFIQGDLLNHTLFGVGIVTLDKGDGKVEVLFETGAKTLVHARA
jgi:hypothetical protein